MVWLITRIIGMYDDTVLFITSARVVSYVSDIRDFADAFIMRNEAEEDGEKEKEKEKEKEREKWLIRDIKRVPYLMQYLRDGTEHVQAVTLT